MTDQDPFLGREIQKSRSFSEHTMETIDEEVTSILQEAAEKAFQLLKNNKNDLQSITDGLLDKEELDRHEIAVLIGPSVHGNDESEARTEADAGKSSDNGVAVSETTESNQL